MGGSSETVFARTSAALSCLLLFAGLWKPNLNQHQRKPLNIRRKSISIWVVPLSKQTFMRCVCVSKFLFLLKSLDLFFAFFDLGFFFFGGGVGLEDLVIGVINGIYGLFWFIVFWRILWILVIWSDNGTNNFVNLDYRVN